MAKNKKIVKFIMGESRKQKAESGKQKRIKPKKPKAELKS